jgi:arylsulfatase
VASPQAVQPGRAQIKLDFAYDGGGRGKGGNATLSVNGQKVAEGRIANTNPVIFSADEASDVGVDEGTPVTEAYKSANSRFTGKIHKVTIDLKPQ